MNDELFDHTDPFQSLNQQQSFGEKLHYLHQIIERQHPFISRIAIALYDPSSDLLSTFVWSGEEQSPLINYQAKLSESPSLADIVARKRPRVVQDMQLFADGANPHTKKLNESRFQASYTMPMYFDHHFKGFVFFNADKTDVFKEHILIELDMMGHMLSLMLQNELAKVQTLVATVKSARAITHTRDPETGAHLDRMSRYARLIAQQLAESHGLSDEYIEHLFLFAPLHDLGKVGIPDDILLKPARLEASEFEIMKTHTLLGQQIIDHLIENYSLSGVSDITMLRNIALYHHEAIDGSGYPEHLQKDEIPLEARIVTVADIFDALTSSRPYKKAWSNDDAFAKIQSLSGIKLDAECVAALVHCRPEIESIQQSFQENIYG